MLLHKMFLMALVTILMIWIMLSILLIIQCQVMEWSVN